MKLSAVVLARVIFFVESVDLNPRGAAYYPDVIRGLVERYGFQTYPQRPEDFNEQTGVKLGMGKFGAKKIDQVVIYNWGISLDTTSSTSDADQLLNDALTWASQTLNTRYDSTMIKRKGYVSYVSFYSEEPLLSLSPALDIVSRAASKFVAASLKLPYNLLPTGVSLGIDPEEQRIPIQRFTIERREGAAFSENKYFSAAPVPTELHLELLGQFEEAIRQRRAAPKQMTAG